jgi:peptidoglycan/LPS O-acetylase OafA/YrhL
MAGSHAARAAKNSQMASLNGLRFALALWVMMTHLLGEGMMLEAWARKLPFSAYSILSSGYLGVATFFVLSGFVLARSYSSTLWDRRKLVKFGVSRFARIYPIYVLSLLVMTPFIITDSVPGKPAVLASYGFLLLGWTGTRAQWNTPAWSLSCQFFFYALFPFAVGLFTKVSWPRTVLLVITCCFLPVGLVKAGVPYAWKPVLHFADFGMGLLASRIYDLLLESRTRLSGRGYWLYWPSIILSIALIAYPAVVPDYLGINGALRPLNAALLLGFSLGGGFAVRWLSSRMLVFLGNASYSLYILHVPLLWWYRRFTATPSPAFYIAAAVALSAAVFQYVERPLNRRIRRWCDSWA